MSIIQTFVDLSSSQAETSLILSNYEAKIQIFLLNMYATPRNVVPKTSM